MTRYNNNNKTTGPHPKVYQGVKQKVLGQPVSLVAPNVDSFGFIRTTSPLTLFDSKHLVDKQPLFWDEEESGGTSVHVANHAMVRLSVTASDGDFMIRQTFQRISYQPSRSQLALFTAKMSIEEGVEKRIGLMESDATSPYNVKGGLYFMMSGSQMHVCEAREGNVIAVAQNDWNFDRMDGYGISGISASWDSSQIWHISYAWLGVGRVAYGLNIDGLNYICHVQDHSNNGVLSGAYISGPSLPVRYEIRSTGGSGSLEQICCSVSSEGGLTLRGQNRSVSCGSKPIAGTTVGTNYVLAGVRLTGSYSSITVLNAYAMDGARGDVHVKLCMNPVVTGSFNWLKRSDSNVEVMSGSEASYTVHEDSLGTVLFEGYAAEASLVSELNSSIVPGISINGTQDEVFLVASPLDSASDLLGSIIYKETD